MKSHTFAVHALISLALAGAAAALVALLPLSPRVASAAWLGVGLAIGSGTVALILKRWAMSRGGTASLPADLKLLGATFALRLVMLCVGLVIVTRHDEGALAFVTGFFGLYLAQQWVEINYLVQAQKHAAPQVGALS